MRVLFAGLKLGAFVFLQDVRHGLFENIVDALVKVNGELLHFLQDHDIEAGCEGFSVDHNF